MIYVIVLHFLVGGVNVRVMPPGLAKGYVSKSICEKALPRTRLEVASLAIPQPDSINCEKIDVVGLPAT